MSRDIQRVLLPGEEQTVQARGDFVYCRQASLPVHVVMDQEPVEMVAGDKLRQPSSFDTFKIENRSSNHTVYLTLVVGRGDYDSQIIRGEVAVEPKLITADGTRRADSRRWVQMWLRPRPGYTPVTYAYGEAIETLGYLDSSLQYYVGGLQWDGEKFALKCDDAWREYDRDFNLLRRRTDMPGANVVNNGATPFCFDDGNTHIFWIGDVNSDHEIRRSLRYPSSDSEERGDRVEASTPQGNEPNNADSLERVGDQVYWFSYVDEQIYKTDVSLARAGNPDWVEVPITHWGGTSHSGTIAWDGEALHSLSDQSSYIWAYDPVTGDLLRQQSSYSHLCVTATFDGQRLIRINDNNLRVRALWHLDQTTIDLRAAASPIGCGRNSALAAPARWQYTLADVTAGFAGLDGVPVEGELIRAALAIYAGEIDAPAGYLDHVYAVEFGDGHEPGARVVRANQTFAAAGLADDFKMRLPGAISIQIDDLLFGES